MIAGHAYYNLSNLKWSIQGSNFSLLVSFSIRFNGSGENIVKSEVVKFVKLFIIAVYSMVVVCRTFSLIDTISEVLV